MEAVSRFGKGSYSCAFLLLGWPVYFLMYYLTETLIPRSRCVPMHLWVDDLIPFCEWFVIPYVLWYFWIVFSLGYFLLRSPESFRRLQTYFIFSRSLPLPSASFFPTARTCGRRCSPGTMR